MPRAPDEISLTYVGPDLREAVLGLAPHPAQERFAGRPHEALAAADADPARRPVAILEGSAPVGLFALHHGPSAGELLADDGDLLLRGFFVDAAAQGRGVGGRALAALPGFVRADMAAVRRIVLSVNVRNPRAIRVYTRAGFSDTGALYLGGTQGPQHVLALAL
jgi:RimJ/RimL family protein N-acetyltransferase